MIKNYRQLFQLGNLKKVALCIISQLILIYISFDSFLSFRSALDIYLIK